MQSGRNWPVVARFRATAYITPKFLKAKKMAEPPELIRENSSIKKYNPTEITK